MAPPVAGPLSTLLGAASGVVSGTLGAGLELADGLLQSSGICEKYNETFGDEEFQASMDSMQTVWNLGIASEQYVISNVLFFPPPFNVLGPFAVAEAVRKCSFSDVLLGVECTKREGWVMLEPFIAQTLLPAARSAPTVAREIAEPSFKMALYFTRAVLAWSVGACDEPVRWPGPREIQAVIQQLNLALEEFKKLNGALGEYGFDVPDWVYDMISAAIAPELSAGFTMGPSLTATVPGLEIPGTDFTLSPGPIAPPPTFQPPAAAGGGAAIPLAAVAWFLLS